MGIFYTQNAQFVQKKLAVRGPFFKNFYTFFKMEKFINCFLDSLHKNISAKRAVWVPFFPSRQR